MKHKDTIEALVAAEQWLETAALRLNHDHAMCEWNDYTRKEWIGRERERLGKAMLQVVKVRSNLERMSA